MAHGVGGALTIMWSLEGITAALAANGRARMAARLLGAVGDAMGAFQRATEPCRGGMRSAHEHGPSCVAT